MKKLAIIFTLIVIGISGFLSWGDEFNPSKDGWYFENFGTDDLSWEQFRRAYLGIYPTQDCAQAPLDCAFYEIFKICAAPGNCGGMSLLGLALYKYGGYFGFCSPAYFYTGGDGPDRDDLREVLNIMQARQFSSSGLTHFLDISDAGNLNDAKVAYDDIKEALAQGDYPVLTIAKDYLAEDAHTVIPYKAEVDSSTGNKIIYIWDPNYPYDDNPADYASTSTANQMVISGPTSWTYRDYSGSGGGWCFAIPMSKYLEKSRHPLAVDIVIDAVMTIFITGTGAAVSQISDDEGHQLYKTNADTHILRSELEDDPARKLKGIIRWPWYAQVKKHKYVGIPFGGKKLKEKKELRGELYFMRRHIGTSSGLNISVSGKKYDAVFSYSGNLIQVSSDSSDQTKDIIRLSRVATAAQALEIKTFGKQRNFAVKQLRTGVRGEEWRSFDIKNLMITQDIPVTLNVVGDMQAVLVSSLDKTVDFNLNIQQRLQEKTLIRDVGKLSTLPGKILKVAPKDWRKLKETELEKENIKRTKIKK